jgi:hypothetical protein
MEIPLLVTVTMLLNCKGAIESFFTILVLEESLTVWDFNRGLNPIDRIKRKRNL